VANSTTNLDVMANDAPAGGIEITSANVLAPDQGGATSVVSSGTRVRYIPATNFTGAEHFTYRIKRLTNADTDTAIVTMTVNPATVTVNAVNDPDETATSGTAKDLSVLANDTVSAGTLEVSAIVTQPPTGEGSVTINTPATTVRYNPPATFTGDTTFVYRARQVGGTATDDATVTVTVTAPATEVVARTDNVTLINNAASVVDVLANDDPEGALIVDTVLTQPANATAAKSNSNSRITVTPSGNPTGTTSFTYRAKLASGTDTDNATVNITWRAPSTHRSGMPWASGCTVGGLSNLNQDAPGSYRRFRGRQIDIVLLYNGGSAWGKGGNYDPDGSSWPAALEDIVDKGNLNLLRQALQQGFRAVYAQGMIPKVMEGRFDKFADGTYDSILNRWAAKLATAINDLGNDTYPVILNFGQETSGGNGAGNGYPWARGNVRSPATLTDYINYYKRCCRAADVACNTGARTIASGNPRVLHGWNVMQNWAGGSDISNWWINQNTTSPAMNGFNIGTYWPISYVTFDGYDHGPPKLSTDAIFQGWANTYEFAGIANPDGIRNVVRFARDKNCGFGVQEWGPGVERSDAGPVIPSDYRDYVAYIRGMHGVFTEVAAMSWPADRPPFEIIFNNTTPNLCHNLNPRNGATNQYSAEYGHLTTPSDEYVRLWSP
jgi:hypothetical protein